MSELVSIKDSIPVDAKIELDVTLVAKDITNRVYDFVISFIKQEVLSKKRGYSFGEEFVLFPHTYYEFVELIRRNSVSETVHNLVADFVKDIIQITYGNTIERVVKLED